jgi:hypothetical protein
MEHSGINPGRNHDAGRLQKEGGTAAPTPTAPTCRAHRVLVGESELDQQGRFDDPYMADHERNRRFN